MQTSDTWPAWRRAMRWGWRRFRADGLMRPAVPLCTVVFFLVACSIVIFFAGVALPQALAANQRVTIHLLPAVANQQVQQFYAALQQVSGVTRATFLSHDQALARERASHPALGQFLDKSHVGNPFSDVFEVTLARSGAAAGVRTLLSQDKWRGVVDVRSLVSLSDQEASLARLSLVAEYAGRVSLLGVILVAALLLCLVTELTRSRIRHFATERTTLLLLGGSWVTIDGPLLIELTLLFLVSVCLAILCFLGLLLAASSLGFTDTLIQSFGVALQAQALRQLPLLLSFAALLAPLCAAVGVLFGSFRAPRHA